MSSIVISRMTFEEARRCADEVKVGMFNIGKKLLELYEGDGWEVLGYTSWRECAQIEFGFKQSHVYRLLDAAEVERNIENSPIGEKYSSPMGESVLRPLSKLPADLQPVAWQQAVETATNGKVTAAHVEATVRTFVTPLPQSAVVSQRVSEVVSTEVRFVPAVAPEEDDEGYDWAQDEPLSVVIAPPARSPEWTSSQMGRKARVEFGFTVHANMKTDLALIEWAKQNGLFVRVDRATEWGNPFHLPGDGDRDTVLDNYEWYLERKPSLLTKISMLKGKVLGCWCYPELCHAGILEERANGEN